MYPHVTVSPYRSVNSTVKDERETLVEVCNDAKIDMLGSPKNDIDLSAYVQTFKKQRAKKIRRHLNTYLSRRDFRHRLRPFLPCEGVGFLRLPPRWMQEGLFKNTPCCLNGRCKVSKVRTVAGRVGLLLFLSSLCGLPTRFYISKRSVSGSDTPRRRKLESASYTSEKYIFHIIILFPADQSLSSSRKLI